MTSDPNPADPSSTAPGPPRHYLTLAAARALECNGCGDCCDSTRTDGYWTWGALPPDQFASLNDGVPLIIPLERIPLSEAPSTWHPTTNHGSAAVWRDRATTTEDGLEFFPTRFQCSAFRPQPDGRGLCGHHDRPRPDRCGEYPVHMPHIETELADVGEVALNTSAFPRCTWYRTTVVAEGDHRLTQPAPA